MQKHPIEENVVSIWMDGRETHANLEPDTSFKGKITITDDSFTIDARDVEVTVKKSKKQTTADENEHDVYVAVQAGCETRTQIMRETNLSDVTVRHHLTNLVEQVLVTEEKVPGKPNVYREVKDE